jgi:malto-oligosyltrehalose trehalohydrolase
MAARQRALTPNRRHSRLSTDRSSHPMPFGAQLIREGCADAPAGVRFRLWAPGCEHVELLLEGADRRLPLQPEAEGWHTLTVAQAQAGSRYRYALPNGALVPDPASRSQPADVHGPSEVIDPCAYRWADRDWHGRPWHEAILYELHVGTFTEAGTFRAAIERLAHLVELGVTAIELLPLADFPGRRNWGYDGVLPFAPDSSYGRPEDLKALIDAAHAHGLMVLLDVVYNHFGPDGNYLAAYAPQFFNERHHTPWGAAINYDAAGSRTVRDFFVHNALYWLQEYHFDGLRLDAVHAIIDESRPAFLEELARRVRSEALPRAVHLVLENERNEAHWLARDAAGRAPLYDAQWNDDMHHVLHVAATGESEGYYAHYRSDDGTQLGRALSQGFVFQGEPMGEEWPARGQPCTDLPPTAFVAFTQNHDQIGNRAFGERLGVLATPEALRAVTATYLLTPQIPMLFMGEEWESTRAFQFFCDFDAELGERVRRGRRAEFARFAAYRDATARERIPDPQTESTFLASKLDWEQLSHPHHAAALRWYQALLTVRTRHIVPLLPHLRHAGEYHILAPGAISACWRSERGSELTLAVNLRSRVTAGFVDTPGRLLWQQGCAGIPQEPALASASPGPGGMSLTPWSVRCSLRS